MIHEMTPKDKMIVTIVGLEIDDGVRVWLGKIEVKINGKKWKKKGEKNTSLEK